MFVACLLYPCYFMKKLVVILGPTASGKTALAHELAGVFAGEIINADSRQMYKELSIGTAKPEFGKDESGVHSIQGIAYHLFDIALPDEEFNLAHYKKLAITTIQAIQNRNKLPFLVGGSGLYIQVIVDNLDLPEVPAQKELRAMLEQKSNEELFLMLKERDIKAAEVIDSGNKRRLVRALEVVITTGKLFSEQLIKGPALFQTIQIGIDIPKEQLFKNIEQRSQEMIDQGLEQEVRILVKKYGWNTLLTSSIGYKEWQGFFEQQKTLEQVKDDIIKHTKALVKKQLTWFAKQKSIHWIKEEKEAKKYIEQFLS